MKKKFYTIPIFIPELACPFQCVFCDQKKISGYNNTPSGNEVNRIIESYLNSFKTKDAVINIGFFGGNFTGIPINQQEEYLKIASTYLDNGDVHGIRLSTRPDYISPDVVALLKNYSVSTVELGAQSFDENVLKKSGRGHKVTDIIQASALIKNADIKLGLQMMIGLPGDTLEKSLFTANEIVRLGADNTRIYPTLVIKGTKLEQLYHEGKYTPLSLTDAVEWSKKILSVFTQNGIDVIRVGLHPSEGLLNGHELAAGPFHVSFKELVLTALWKDRLIEHLDENKKNIIIKVASEQLNYAVGYKASNKKMLAMKFQNVKYIADPSLKDFEFDVIYN
jgi:histone acetyltransferase (RNA polymerase elongator complex component)